MLFMVVLSLYYYYYYYALYCSGFIIACFAQHSSLLTFKNIQVMKLMFIIFKVFHFICHVFLWPMWERKKKKNHYTCTVMSHIILSIRTIVILQQIAENSERTVLLFIYLYICFTIICDGFWIWVAIIELCHEKKICNGTDIICNLAKHWIGSVL